MRIPRLANLAWTALVYNLGVIAFGAFVRATGSGAGCGRHWPVCNGEVIPRPERIETIIEYTHRVTSGVALLMVVALVVVAHRATRPGHLARRAAWVSLLLVLTEAGLGAGLVLFELVAENASFVRAVVMGAHLINTFLLLAALVTTALHAEGVPLAWPRLGRTGALTWIGIGLLLLTGFSGGIAALGDTLFPAASLREGLRHDFSPLAHTLVRLRVFHPLLAIVTAAAVVLAARGQARSQPRARRAAGAASSLAMLQLAIGFTNLMLLAPVPLQLLHLLGADALWIAYVASAAMSAATVGNVNSTTTAGRDSA